MSKDSRRIQSLVSEKRVKLHVFEPTQRKIWTVVGKSNEHSGFLSALISNL
jgi:hypothetical protein